MNTTQRIIVQVPMHKELKQKADLVARKNGFSSLQDAIRMFLTKFANGQLTVSIEEPDERLSPKAEKRYAKIISDIKKGKNVTKTDSLDELFSSLDS